MSLGTWNRRSTRYQKFLNLCNVFLLITSTILIFSAVVLMSFYHLTKVELSTSLKHNTYQVNYFQLDFWSWYFFACPMVMLGLGLYTFLVCVYGFLISTRESRLVFHHHLSNMFATLHLFPGAWSQWLLSFWALLFSDKSSRCSLHLSSGTRSRLREFPQLTQTG